MGMYTELVLKCRIKEDTSQEVLTVLHYLFKNRLVGATPLDHPFFKAPRWTMIGNSSSFYHHPEAVSDLYEFDQPNRGVYIFSRSDLKNYDNEIALFLDWINPYLDHMPGECIGWTWYEEEEQPTLIYCK